MDDFNQRMDEIMSDPIMLSRANECKDSDELYALCESFFPNVSKDEFISSLDSLEEDRIINDYELESVAGGGTIIFEYTVKIKFS